MQDYRVQLDVYHGPLDLLLYLIKRDEIDINDIPIAPITEQYLAYLQTIKKLDINLAGEFLVMAATLMEIKSALMMPREAGEEEGEESELTAAEDPTDPRYELIQQLLAYKRFKDAAGQLDERREEFAARFARAPAPGSLPTEDDKQIQLEIDDVSLWDLVEAFGRMMEQVGIAQHQHEVTVDDTPIELHAADLVDRLERDGPMTLQQAFEGRRHGEMVGLFLATLELVRQRKLRVTQDKTAGEIQLQLRDPDEVRAEIEAESNAPERQAADPKDADAFAWPDEKTRQRYVRRLERRAKGEFVEEDAEWEADLAELESQDSADEASEEE